MTQCDVKETQQLWPWAWPTEGRAMEIGAGEGASPRPVLRGKRARAPGGGSLVLLCGNPPGLTTLQLARGRREQRSGTGGQGEPCLPGVGAGVLMEERALQSPAEGSHRESASFCVCCCHSKAGFLCVCFPKSPPHTAGTTSEHRGAAV